MNIMALIQQLMGQSGGAGLGGGGGRGWNQQPPLRPGEVFNTMPYQISGGMGRNRGQGMVGSLPDFATGNRLRRPSLEQSIGMPHMNTVAGPQYDQADVDNGAPVVPGNNLTPSMNGPQSSMDMMALLHQLGQRGRLYPSGRGRGGGSFNEDPGIPTNFG